METPITPSNGRALSLTPGARVLQTPLSDETIWKRLKESGFDEESIKRRDKAALITYIAKLEAEIYDLQHHMGLLILERKDLASKYEQIKVSAESAELAHRREQAAHLSAIAEAKKREDSLKKALGVEKECLASIEKALHEIRAESAETKVAADCKLAEACNMMEDAQKKIIDAQQKLNAAEVLQAEANRYHRSAERKLQELEAREDDLSRRMSDFKVDFDAKDKEISLERQTLSERRKILQQEQESLLDGQALLNQREDYIASKSQELNRLEKELEASKSNLQKDVGALNVEKSKLELTMSSLSLREEDVVARETMLSKREQELLVLQGNIASKESAEIQKAVANHENVLRIRKSEFEAELEMKRKLVEDEMETKRRSWELKEVDISQREELLLEREHDVEVQARALTDKEKDVVEKMKFLDDKEQRVANAVKDITLQRALLQEEKEGISKMKLNLQKSLESLEDKKKQVDCAKEQLETMKCETDELSVLEIKLKEEVEIVRAQKLELMAEEERLEGEKAKFEAEWELIDERREELRKEAERVATQREAVSRLLKDERDNLWLEKEAMRAQHKRDVEALNCEREEFMNKIEHEHSDWLSKIQQEHADFLLGIEMQKRELESSTEKRREEVESYLKDKEKAFELEKKNELDHINALREKGMTDLEQVALQTKKLETERKDINLDRERRDREWEVLNKSIQDLKDQTLKLEKQRELLHAEREEISSQIEQLCKLEDLKLALERMEVAQIQQSNMESNQRKISDIKYSKLLRAVRREADLVSDKNAIINGNGLDSSTQKPDFASPASARFSWIKRCTELMFKSSPELSLMKSEQKSLICNDENARMTSAGKVDSSNGYPRKNLKSGDMHGEGQHINYAFAESEGTLEVSLDGEITKGTDENESNNPKQRLQARRKRRVTNSDLDDCIDPIPVQKHSNKKRRQQENTILNSLDVTLSQAIAPVNRHAAEGSAENTDVLIEKTVKISEVTCEITHTYNNANEEHLNNSEAAADCNISQYGGTNNHMNLRGVENNKVHCGLEVAKISNKETKNVGDGSEHNQSQEDASTQGDLQAQDPLVAKSDNGKVIENAGRRTRSKQKL